MALIRVIIIQKKTKNVSFLHLRIIGTSKGNIEILKVYPIWSIYTPFDRYQQADSEYV